MLFPESQVRIWLYARPCAAAPRASTGWPRSPRASSARTRSVGSCLSSSCAKRTQMKVLYFDRSGYCVWSKRLEQGQFHVPANGQAKRRLTWTDLKLIIEGIDRHSVHQFKRYHRPSGEANAIK